MKKVIRFLVVVALLFVPVILMAQTGDEVTSEGGSNLWNWILTVGVGGVAAFFPAAWKKIKGFSVKLADLLLTIMDELYNVRIQISEATSAGRNLVTLYQEAIDDNNLSPEEQTKFASRFAKFIDELDDVMPAFQGAIERIKEAITDWKT